jgi:hypothetical protein
LFLITPQEYGFFFFLFDPTKRDVSMLIWLIVPNQFRDGAIVLAKEER